MIGRILNGEESVDYSPLSRFVLSFGNKPRRLCHPRLIYLVMYIRNGKGHCFVDDQFIPLTGGSLLVVNPFSFLQLQNVEHLQGEVIAFTESFFCLNHFNETLLYKVVYQAGRMLTLQTEEDTVIKDYLSSAVVMFKRKHRMEKVAPVNRDLMLNLLTGIILLLHKKQLATEKGTYDIADPYAKNKVVAFIQLLNIHFSEHDSVEFYADKMGISSKSLTSFCQHGIGWTPKSIIQSKILIEARRLLLFDDKSVAEVSFHLGFTEPSAFITFFKKHTNMTPGEFKNKHQEMMAAYTSD